MPSDNTLITITGIIAVAALQIVAWIMGYDGAIFAFTSAIIGGLLGIGINVKKSVSEYNEVQNGIKKE